MTKAQMKQWLFNSLDELQEEFTGYEEHERKRALQARKRGDESDYQPWDLPDLGIESMSSALQANSLPSDPLRKPGYIGQMYN